MVANSKNPLNAVNWKQAAGEALLLLVGVMLALSAQAWWEAREERQTVSEYVDNLLAEVKVNKASVQEAIGNHQRYIELGTALLKDLIEAESADNSASIQAKLSAFVYIADFRPATSALDNLVGGGGLGLIESAELQLAISRYAQKLSDHNVLQAELAELFFQHLIPFISDSLPLLQVDFVGGGLQEPLPESQFAIDLTALKESMQFENLVVRRISAEVDAVKFARRLIDAADALIGLLEDAG